MENNALHHFAYGKGMYNHHRQAINFYQDIFQPLPTIQFKQQQAPR